MKERIINVLAAFETDNIGKSFPLDYCLPLYHTVSDKDLPISGMIQYKNTRQFEEDLDYISGIFSLWTGRSLKISCPEISNPQKK
jgi:hypothetical protein